MASAVEILASPERIFKVFIRRQPAHVYQNLDVEKGDIHSAERLRVCRDTYEINECLSSIPLNGQVNRLMTNRGYVSPSNLHTSRFSRWGIQPLDSTHTVHRSKFVNEELTVSARLIELLWIDHGVVWFLCDISDSKEAASP